jgi:hypothetical protein
VFLSKNLSQFDHGADSLLRAPVGGFQSRRVKKGEDSVSFAQQMIVEASVFPRTRATMHDAIQVCLQLSPYHVESMFADRALLAAVGQR